MKIVNSVKRLELKKNIEELSLMDFYLEHLGGYEMAVVSISLTNSTCYYKAPYGCEHVSGAAFYDNSPLLKLEGIDLMLGDEAKLEIAIR